MEENEIETSNKDEAPKEEQVFEFKPLKDEKINLTDSELAKFREQCQSEHKIGNDFIRPKREKWYKQLKVYNNQKRDEDAVGDTLLFTVFQTVLASLYDDTLSVEFDGHDEGDDEQAENLNAVAEYDYVKMRKEQIDFDWDWDAGFFGRGLLEYTGFDRKTMTPIPSIIDPLIFIRDPEATNEYDLRFYGKEISLTMRELEANPSYENLESLEQRGGSNPGLNKNALQARRDAQGLNNSMYNDEIGDNKKYDLIEWYTYLRDRKVLATWSYDFKELVRLKYLKSDSWNLITRPLFPSSHEWDGHSIVTLTEDKHRARAVMTNTMLKGAQAQIMPTMLYDRNKITNRADMNFGINKAIGIDGAVSDAIARPMATPNMSVQIADYIISLLTTSAERATATPEIQQGATSSQQKTLGEINLSSQKSDVRYSLAARIFKWSEKAFWLKWYYQYKINFKNGIDKKVIRIVGTFDKRWRTLTKENLITENDPDITVVSRIVLESQREKLLQRYVLFYKEIINDPTSDRRYALKFMGKLIGLKSDEIKKHLPADPEELQAEMENEQLNKDELPAIERDDNHQMHIIIHEKANATKAGIAHMKAHWEAIRLKKTNPELFPQQQEGVIPGQQSPNQMGQGGQPTSQPMGGLNINSGMAQ